MYRYIGNYEHITIHKRWRALKIRIWYNSNITILSLLANFANNNVFFTFKATCIKKKC